MELYCGRSILGLKYDPPPFPRVDPLRDAAHELALHMVVRPRADATREQRELYHAKTAKLAANANAEAAKIRPLRIIT